jgi:hypothetical protein
MKLSEHFTLEEFINSPTAKSRGLSNEPTDEHKQNLINLVEHTLEPLRTALERSIKVTSGYRSQDLNKAVGGSKTSQHSKGQAADIVVSGMSPVEVCKFVLDNNIPFDQLIQEFNSWVHISYNKEGNRKQVLTAKKVDGKTVYLNGLVD